MFVVGMFVVGTAPNANYNVIFDQKEKSALITEEGVEKCQKIDFVISE